MRSGVYVYTSGQLPMVDGKLAVTGKVGAEVTADEAKELAKTCALNALAAVKSVAGDLDRIARVVKVVGFVASASDFTGQPGVVNGASELLGAVLGDKGVHARSAVGVAVLPLDAPVEIEVQVELVEA
ncbi:LysR family transcriptional regulator [Streptomyces clavifer]|nr:LysR family transcriptional regulator [Streptomyces clavifer]